MNINLQPENFLLLTKTLINFEVHPVNLHRVRFLFSQEKTLPVYAESVF